MNKPVKIIAIVVSLLLGLIILIKLIPIIFMAVVFKTITDEVSIYTSKDDSIKEYVQDHYDLEIDILYNSGPPDFASSEGRVIVETKEPDPLKFDIKIGWSRMVKGDNYKEIKAYKQFNDDFQQSEDYLRLKNIGLNDILFERTDLDSVFDLDPAFILFIPEDANYWDSESLQTYETAISILNSWQEKALQQYDIDFHQIKALKSMDDLRFPNSQIVTINLNEQYDSIKDLGNKIAADNVRVFSSAFILEDMKKVDTIAKDLHGLAFYHTRSDYALICEKMKVLVECSTYALVLQHEDGEGIKSSEQFRYDQPEVKKHLFNAIQLIQDLDLPINKIFIRRLYVPNELENQHYTETELEEKDIRASFITKDVMITNIKEILSVDDIYFEESTFLSV